MSTATRLRPREVRDYLSSQGRCFVTGGELVDLLGVRPESLHSSLRAARERREVANVCGGGWVAIPESAHAVGLPRVEAYLDEMMQHLGRDYQLGLTAAAECYGATHRRSALRPVLSPARLAHGNARAAQRMNDGGLVAMKELRWMVRANPSERGVERRPVPESTGALNRFVNYSPAEIAMLDCVQYPRIAIGWDNIANIATRFIYFDSLDPEKLARLALDYYPATVRQRLGYVLDVCAEWGEKPFDTDPLRETLDACPDLTRLMPGVDHFFAPVYEPEEMTHTNRRWRVIVNTLLDIDA